MLRRLYIFYFAIIFIFILHTVSVGDDEFRFKNADGLKILIYDNNMEPEGNRILSNFHDIEFIIDGEGYLQLGSFGRFYIANMTVEEATNLFKEKFRTFGKDLTIIVLPLIRLALRGEFGKPGMYRFSPSTSFWDVVATAGGMTNSLAAENMYVMREGEIIYAEFWESLHAGSSLRELGIQSGDEIVAPRINRISFNAIMRYINFFASIVVVYYAVSGKGQN